MRRSSAPITSYNTLLAILRISFYTTADQTLGMAKLLQLCPCIETLEVERWLSSSNRLKLPQDDGLAYILEPGKGRATPLCPRLRVLCLNRISIDPTTLIHMRDMSTSLNDNDHHSRHLATRPRGSGVDGILGRPFGAEQIGSGARTTGCGQ